MNYSLKPYNSNSDVHRIPGPSVNIRIIYRRNPKSSIYSNWFIISTDFLSHPNSEQNYVMISFTFSHKHPGGLKMYMNAILRLF